MDLSISTENGKKRARVTGRLDTTNSEEFEKKMAPLRDGGTPAREMDGAQGHEVYS